MNKTLPQLIQEELEQITEVTNFRTSDNRLFSSRMDAVNHAHDLAAALTEKPQEHRRFRHKDGFADDSLYLIWDGKKIYIVTKAGTVLPTYNWPLEYCLKLVKAGEWIEIFGHD